MLDGNHGLLIDGKQPVPNLRDTWRLSKETEQGDCARSVRNQHYLQATIQGSAAARNDSRDVDANIALLTAVALETA